MRTVEAEGIDMVALAPLLAIAAGVWILVAPQHMRFVVAGYLIVVGLLGLGILRS